MKIWFDISNSPHVNMFYDLILELEKEGHTAVITSRPLANTVELLDQKGLKHTIVGEHYGKNFYKKLVGYPIRVLQLKRYLKKQKLDLAVSQSSFHSPVTAKLLGVPSIYTNDNEHAMGNIPAFICATQIFIPENLPVENISKKGISRKKIKQYPGVKEGIYLWKKAQEITKKRAALSTKTIKIYIRPEPLTAQYYKAKQNFLDDMLCELQEKYQITVLVRDKTQLNYYNQTKFNKLLVPSKPIDFDEIATYCSLFIGAGGSMTRELAILGIPTISVYQDELLAVDEYLILEGVLKHEPAISAKIVEDYLKSVKHRTGENEIMKKGKMAYEFLKSEILSYDQLRTKISNN